MQTIKRNVLKLTAVFALVATLFGSGLNRSVAHAASCAPDTFRELWAKTGSAVLYGSTSVTIWGYSDTQLGSAVLPGPVLEVNQGNCVQVILHNNLTEPTALLFQGQAMIPDTAGAVAGSDKIYIFAANKPGTFLYEAGLIPGKQHQVAMGLYGALIVHPSVPSAASSVEKTLVLSEFDATLAANPIGFDMRKYAPKYFLINGKAYPGAASIPAAAGSAILLRYVNAGLQAHAMSTLGLSQKAIAMDGNPFAHPHSMVSETIAPGQTLDALIAIPAGAITGAKYPLYDANLMLRNTNAPGLGGMLTFLTVGTPPPPPNGDTSGPPASGVTLAPNPASGFIPVTVDAIIDDTLTDNSNIAAAEFYVDSASSSPTPMTAVDLAFDSPVESVTGVIPTALLGILATGDHTIYVRGRDSAGNWGPFGSAVLNLLDHTGPILSSLGLSPNPSNGTVGVALSFTANDTMTGNSNVTAAEYWVDGNVTHTPITVGSPAPVVTLNSTIAAGLAHGTHVVSARAQDSLGNWSATATINLVVDNLGPTTSTLSLSPNPSSGSVSVNLSFTADDSAAGNSNIIAAEYTVDAGAPQAISIASPTPLKILNATIPAGLGAGTHIVSVRSRDAVGNWGGSASINLVVDNAPPTVGNVSASPNPNNGAWGFNTSTPAVRVTAGLSDVSSGGSNIAAAEGFVDAVGATGTGFAMIAADGSFNSSSETSYGDIPLAVVNSLAEGNHTIYVHAKDAVGFWSNALSSSTTLVIKKSLYFSTLGNTNPPGAAGTADDADIYLHNGSAFSRVFDATTVGVPGSANVDGFDRIDVTHFYVSFSGDVTLPAPAGAVQDEDIVYYNAGVWSVYFDGTAGGLTNNNQDIDAFSIVGSTLYFSTTGNTNPPTLAGCPAVGGTADDADIYSWNGTCFSRVIDVTAALYSVPGAANVDGLVRVDATHFYLSFVDDTTLTGLGTVQDEDVVYYNNGVWLIYFDGTAKGLTANNQDIDAFDLP